MDSCVDRSTAISTRVRLFRLFLLIPCWESQRLIPKRSAGPRATKIGVVSLKALDHHRPNREESPRRVLVCHASSPAPCSCAKTRASGSPSLSFQPEICDAKQPTQASSSLVRQYWNTFRRSKQSWARSRKLRHPRRQPDGSHCTTSAPIAGPYWRRHSRSERGPRWPSLKSLSAECLWEPTGDPDNRRAGVAMLARNRGAAASALLTSVARRAIAGATVSFRRSHRFRRWPKAGLLGAGRRRF